MSGDGLRCEETKITRAYIEGLARFEFGGKVGYLDLNDKVVISAQFDHGLPFSEGKAAVRIGEKWGYVDRMGGVIINPQFDEVDGFHEGLAAARTGSLWGFIDLTGEFVIPPQYGPSLGFSEGIAVVTDPMINQEEGSWRGAIDRTGAVVVPFQFYNISDFSDGLAIANSGREDFFIDRHGKRLNITSLWVDWCFRDGLVAIAGEEGRRVYIDKSGHVVAPFEKNPIW